MPFLSAKKIYKKNYLILIILFLGLFLRTIYLDSSYIFWDESIYLMGGKALANQPAGYTELDFRPPLLPVLITLFAFFPDHYVLLSKIFMILINSTLITFVYILGKQFSKSIGLLSAFFTSIWPYHLMSSSWVMTDGPTAILLLITLLLYFKGFKQDKNSFIYFGGFFLSLAVLMKFTNLLLLILLIPLFILNLRKIKIIAKSLLISLLIFSPYLITNYIYFGNPIYGILKAFSIGNIMLETVGLHPLKIIFKVFYDFFGIVISIFIFVGIIFFIKEEILSKTKTKKRQNMFWVYCLIVFLPYYIYLVHEGTTPIWWDPQRFLLSFLPFFLLFATYFIIKLINNFPTKSKSVILASLILLVLLSWTQQYARFMQPSIEYEDGLRQVTKEIGLYLKNEKINNLLCLGNCPSIAYYSDKKTSIVYHVEEFKLNPSQYGVIFSDNMKNLKNPYEKIKTICKEKWCVYLLKNLDKKNNFSIEDLSLEEKIGQMIITAVPSDKSELEDMFKKYHIGGFIYMAWPGDIEDMNQDQAASFSESLQKKSKIPLFITADVEGGKVNRISDFLEIKTNQEYGKGYEFAKDKEHFLKDYRTDIGTIAEVLKDAGINVNLAPVLDVEQTLEDGVLSKDKRSYSKNYQTVTDLGSAYINEMEKNGILTTAKHFPGHGHTDCDTYLKNCKINVSKEYIENNDMLPFVSAIKNNVGFIMVGLFKTPYDEKNRGILSKPVVTDLLRNRLGYGGLIITDDFMMGATKNLGREYLSTQAILAGNDILLTTNPNDVPVIYNSLLSAVKNGIISERKIDESVNRILNAKKKISKS